MKKELEFRPDVWQRIAVTSEENENYLKSISDHNNIPFDDLNNNLYKAVYLAGLYKNDAKRVANCFTAYEIDLLNRITWQSYCNEMNEDCTKSASGDLQLNDAGICPNHTRIPYEKFTFEVYLKDAKTGQGGYDIAYITAFGHGRKEARRVLDSIPLFDCVITATASYNGLPVTSEDRQKAGSNDWYFCEANEVN